MKTDKIIGIAKVCHETNRAYCQTIGDNTQPTWEDAPKWQKQSAINGVKYHLENPNSKPEDSHNSWLKEKEQTGWKYGKVKDPEKKEHPCFVPYEQLPEEQKAKDKLFISIIRSLNKDNTFDFICDMDEETQRNKQIIANKTLRKDLDTTLQNLKDCQTVLSQEKEVWQLQNYKSVLCGSVWT